MADDFNIDDILAGLDDEETAKRVDEAFKALIDGYENDVEVEKTASAIMEAEYVIAEAEKHREELQAQADEIAAEEAALEKRLAEIKRKKSAVRVELFDVRAKVTRTEREKNSSLQYLGEAKKNVDLAKEMEEKRATLHDRMKNFIWFTGNSRGDKILPHQVQAAELLATAKRAMLGDGMGLGKTLSTIAAMDLAEAKKVLVVAPSDVTSNFVEEIKSWAPHRIVINIRGMSKADRNTAMEMLDMLDSYVLVMNYEAWRKDFSLLSRLGNLGLDTVILDEAHTIKNSTSDVFRGVEDFVLAHNICPRCDDGKVMKIAPTNVIGAGLFRRCATCGWNGESVYVDGVTAEEMRMRSRSVKNIWPITGTLILNSPADIFPALHLIDPHQFEKKNDFLRSYCQMDQYTGKWRFSNGGLEYLTKHTLRGRFIARTMEDAGIILPPQKPITHSLTLTEQEYPLQRQIVDQLTKHSQIVLESGQKIDALAIIALITRQRQANVWPGGIQLKDPMTGEVIFKVSEEVQESIKIDKAVELITDLVSQGKRVALFSQFTTALEELQKRIDGLEVDGKTISSVRYDGKTNDSTKIAVKTNFDKKMGEVAKWDVVLAHYKSGGVGLNFTACEHTIILDREWNPGKEEQALARTRRIGQDAETFVHMIEVEKSIDQWLNGIHEEKQELIDGFNENSRDMQAEYLAALKGMTK